MMLHDEIMDNGHPVAPGTMDALLNTPGPVWAGIHPQTGEIHVGKRWTMPEIKAANASAGGHWFDRASMRHFGTRLLPRHVYHGPGGIFFVHEGDNYNRTQREYNVSHFHPESGDIDTVHKFDVPSRSFGMVENAADLARNLASGSVPYADWYRRYLGQDVPDSPPTTPREGDAGWISEQYARRGVAKAIQYEAYRAPAGGTIVAGTFYAGGKLIPNLKKFLAGIKKTSAKSKAPPKKPLVVSFGKNVKMGRTAKESVLPEEDGGHPGYVWRVHPQGSELHSANSETSNGDSIPGVFVFKNLNELAASDWMNEKNVELAKIKADDRDLFDTSDVEGCGLKRGRGQIVARAPFKDIRELRDWATAHQRNDWKPTEASKGD
jgi:hypothetical protein